jgi:ATP-dependent HslUV protease ATP-binding subunit HslU
MNYSPEQIFAELDRHVIGQTQAKRAVAIALRNRWRRLQLTSEEQASINPHHILMIGPSGVGKTALAKQLARLSDSPFIKVEATQYTEVGYVGKDITSIVEEVVAAAESLLLSQQAPGAVKQKVQVKVEKSTEKPEANPGQAVQFAKYFKLCDEKIRIACERISDLYEVTKIMSGVDHAIKNGTLSEFKFESLEGVREAQFIREIEAGKHDDKMITVPRYFAEPFSSKAELALDQFSMTCLAPMALMESRDVKEEDQKDLSDAFKDSIKAFKKYKSVTIGKLRKLWTQAANAEAASAVTYSENPHRVAAMSDLDELIKRTLTGMGMNASETRAGIAGQVKAGASSDPVKYAENYGIIFIDEFDKLAGVASDRGQVSRQGVQRDLLPLLDGCVIKTRYGNVDTTNILFICSGAFQMNKPEELMVEIQGRLPIRVQMEALSADDFVKILRIKEDNILDQYRKLMAADGIDLLFEDQAVKTIAEIAFQLNMNHGNYGARRLYGCVEKVLEDITYLSSPNKRISVTITKEYVENHLYKS